MCITTCPNEFISGVGLKPYFSAGIESAAATIFFSYRVNWLFTVVVTGFATGPAGAASCAAQAAPVASRPATTNPNLFIVISPLRLKRSSRAHPLRARSQGSIPPPHPSDKQLSGQGITPSSRPRKMIHTADGRHFADDP